MSSFEARLLHVSRREISAGISEEAEVPTDSVWFGEFALAFLVALVLNVLDKRDLVCRCETALNILKSG